MAMARTKMTSILSTKLFPIIVNPMICAEQRCLSNHHHLAEKQHDDRLAMPELPPFDYSPLPYSGPTADEIIAKRKQYLSPSICHLYKTPVRVIN